MKKKYFIIILVIIVSAVIGLRGYQYYSHQSNVKSIYQTAENLIVKEDFVSALALLNGIKTEGYQDTETYIYLCESYQAYDNGNVDAAYRKIRYETMICQNELVQDKIYSYIEKISAEYEVWYEQDIKERRIAYVKELRSGVPFIGMSESDISHTSLGSPSSTIRHNNECISGEQYQANLYDFMNNGCAIFTARCVQGKVIQVWDTRETTHLQNKNSSGSKPAEYDSDTEKSDPYNVYDYCDPEDFYDDNYDDFYDYEDAEDYWYDAHH